MSAGKIFDAARRSARMIGIAGALASAVAGAPKALADVVIQPRGTEVSRFDYYANFYLSCSGSVCTGQSDITQARKRIEIKWVSCQAFVRPETTSPEIENATLRITPGQIRGLYLVPGPRTRVAAGIYQWTISQPAPMVSPSG